MNRCDINAYTVADVAGILCPTRREDLKATGFDGLILVVCALLKLKYLLRAFDIFGECWRFYHTCCCFATSAFIQTSFMIKVFWNMCQGFIYGLFGLLPN